METLKIKTGKTVKLTVKISSDANVGSNVHLDDVVVKKSITNNFNVELGTIDDLDGKSLSVVSNFFVSGGLIDAVMETTIVECIISTEMITESFLAEKVKINPLLFMSYIVLKLEKTEDDEN